jgi:hypothetical protein
MLIIVNNLQLCFIVTTFILESPRNAHILKKASQKMNLCKLNNLKLELSQKAMFVQLDLQNEDVFGQTIWCHTGFIMKRMIKNIFVIITAQIRLLIWYGKS